MVLAHPLAHTEIARGETVEIAAVLVGTGEARKIVAGRNDFG